MTIDRLHQLFLQFPKACTDTRQIQDACIFFALKGENFDGNKFASEALRKGAAYAVIDNAEYEVAGKTLLVEDVLSTLQELSTFHRNFCSAGVIALTGSNGKTTTKELISGVLSRKYKTVATQGNFNNHIGVPLTLLTIKQDTEMAIIEMGANHEKEIEFLCELTQPDFGYITNFGKDHLEGFGSEEGVIRGNSELYDYLIHHDKYIFLNADDPIQLSRLSAYAKKIGFTASLDNYYRIDFLGAHPFVELLVEDTKITTQLVGSYNFSNCCAAVIIGKYFNVPIAEIKEAIEYYIPQNNRSQLVEKDGHQIILDAYNANPSSMKAALDSFRQMEGGQKVVFLGDMFELGKLAVGEHQDIAELVEKMDLKDAYLIGDNFSKTQTSLKKCRTFEELSDYLKDHPLSASQILIKGSRGMALERIVPLL